MATYSQYATGGFGSDTIDESYNGIEGAFRLIEENSINEHAIFEHIIGQDFAEVMAKNGAISESSYESILESEASGLWGKFVEFIEKIKNKILGILRNFKNRIQMIFIKDGKELVNKYDKVILKKLNSSGLTKMKFKYSKVKSTSPVTPEGVTKNSICNTLDKSKITELTNNAIGSIRWMRKLEDEGNAGKTQQDIDPNHAWDDDKAITDDEKENLKDALLTQWLGSNTDSKSFQEDLFDKVFEDEEEIEGLDFSLYAQIKDILSNGKKLLDTIDKEEKLAKKYYTELKKQAEEHQKVFLRGKNTIIAQHGNKLVSRATTLTTLGSSCVTTMYAGFSAVVKKQLKQARAVFTKAVTYNQKASANEQASLLEAVVEVSNYEVDEMFA